MNTLLYLVASSFVNVVRFLPLKFLGFVGRQIGFVFYFIDFPHRKVAVNNLTNSLGSSRSRKEIIALARENFRRLGEVYLIHQDRPHSAEKLGNILTIKGVERLDESTRRRLRAEFYVGNRSFGN